MAVKEQSPYAHSIIVCFELNRGFCSGIQKSVTTPALHRHHLRDTTSSERWRCVSDVRVASAEELVTIYNRVR